MRITLITQCLSLDSVRQQCPHLFSALDQLKIAIQLDNSWDGSISHLKILQLDAPTLIHVPKTFKSPPEELARYCAEHQHILFVDDVWIDIKSKQRFREDAASDVLIVITVPGESDMRAVRIPLESWKRLSAAASTRNITVENAVQILFSDTMYLGSKGTPVAPIAPGTLIPGIGVLCGGPCKKFHPLQFPSNDDAIARFLDGRGWKSVPDVGYVCPECFAAAKSKSAPRPSIQSPPKKEKT